MWKERKNICVKDEKRFKWNKNDGREIKERNIETVEARAIFCHTRLSVRKLNRTNICNKFAQISSYCATKNVMMFVCINSEVNAHRKRGGGGTKRNWTKDAGQEIAITKRNSVNISRARAMSRNKNVKTIRKTSEIVLVITSQTDLINILFWCARASNTDYGGGSLYRVSAIRVRILICSFSLSFSLLISLWRKQANQFRINIRRSELTRSFNLCPRIEKREKKISRPDVPSTFERLTSAMIYFEAHLKSRNAL